MSAPSLFGATTVVTSVIRTSSYIHGCINTYAYTHELSSSYVHVHDTNLYRLVHYLAIASTRFGNTLEVPQGAGSGFMWDTEGHVVTNYHVSVLGCGLSCKFRDGDTIRSSSVVRMSTTSCLCSAHQISAHESCFQTIRLCTVLRRSS